MHYFVTKESKQELLLNTSLEWGRSCIYDKSDHQKSHSDVIKQGCSKDIYENRSSGLTIGAILYLKEFEESNSWSAFIIRRVENSQN